MIRFFFFITRSFFYFCSSFYHKIFPFVLTYVHKLLLVVYHSLFSSSFSVFYNLQFEGQYNIWIPLRCHFYARNCWRIQLECIHEQLIFNSIYMYVAIYACKYLFNLSKSALEYFPYNFCLRRSLFISHISFRLDYLVIANIEKARRYIPKFSKLLWIGTQARLCDYLKSEIAGALTENIPYLYIYMYIYA